MNEGWPLSGTFSISLSSAFSFDIFMKEYGGSFASQTFGSTTGAPRGGELGLIPIICTTKHNPPQNYKIYHRK